MGLSMIKPSVLNLKTKLVRYLKCTPFKQNLKLSVQATSTAHDDYTFLPLKELHRRDHLDYWEDVQRLKQKVSSISVQSTEVECRESGSLQDIVGEAELGNKEKLSPADFQSQKDCDLEEAEISEGLASLGVAWSVVGVCNPYWLFTIWQMKVSLSFQMPFFTTEEPFQKQPLAVKAGGFLSEVPINPLSLSKDENDDLFSNKEKFCSEFMDVCDRTDEPQYNSCRSTSSGRSDQTPPISSERETGKKRKKPKRPAIVMATGDGSSSKQTTKGQQRGQETTSKQSSTHARVTSSSPGSQSGGANGACGGTGGEKPPDDERPREKPLPEDAPENKDQEGEGKPKIPSNDHNVKSVAAFLLDDGRSTGRHLRRPGNLPAGHQLTASASLGRKPPHDQKRDDDSFSGRPSRKTGNQTKPAPLAATNACRWASPGVASQDGSQSRKSSLSPTIHTRFGDYKDSQMYQRPRESNTKPRSLSPLRYLSGTPVFKEFEEQPTPPEESPSKPIHHGHASSISSQPELLRGEDTLAVSDTSSQTNPEIPSSQEIPEEHKQRNLRESGQGSGLSELEKEYYALMRENFLLAAHNQEDPLKMEELMQEANSLPEDLDHDPGGEEN